MELYDETPAVRDKEWEHNHIVLIIMNIPSQLQYYNHLLLDKNNIL